MDKLYRVENDWAKYGIDACLRNAFFAYCTQHENKPTTIYCSTNFAQLYQLSLCGFAVKHMLKIHLIKRKDFEKPYFFFGGDSDGQDITD